MQDRLQAYTIGELGGQKHVWCIQAEPGVKRGRLIRTASLETGLLQVKIGTWWSGLRALSTEMHQSCLRATGAVFVSGGSEGVS